MGLFDFLFYGWEPRKGKWYRNHKKTTFIVDPAAGWHPVVIGKDVRYTNCYIIRDGKKRRGSFKVIGSKVRFIEGWKYRRDSVKTIDKKDCVFSKSTWGTWTYKMKIKKSISLKSSKKSTRIRKKGVALVEGSQGFLVVKMGRGSYVLPGGGADRGESRKRAAMRELREETGLKATSAKLLFSYNGGRWHDHKGRGIKNHAKVFLVKATGRARPHHEIKHVAWWKPGSKLKISETTKWIIEKYLEEKHG
jgi:8-oxo-dGTP diphosphatase